MLFTNTDQGINSAWCTPAELEINETKGRGFKSLRARIEFCVFEPAAEPTYLSVKLGRTRAEVCEI